MSQLKTITVIDPLTKKDRILTPEEQADLLEKGIFIDKVLPKKNHGQSWCFTI